jgi:predicted DNA-binding protein
MNMENTLKREDFVRLRINSIEKERLLKIEKLTGRKRSDLVREAVYRFIKTEYPEFLNRSGSGRILTCHFC